MRFRDVVREAFYGLTAIKDSYMINCNGKPRKDLLEVYLYWQLLVIYPICPHLGEVIYQDQFVTIVDSAKYPRFLFEARFPEVKKEQIDFKYIQSDTCITEFFSTMRRALEKAKKATKDKNHKFSKATVIYRRHYQPFQLEVLKVLRKLNFVNN
jgi:leucyl-tRNA synthetase